MVRHRYLLERAALLQALERQDERHEATGDCGRARAAVRLNDVTVDPDGPFTEGLELGDGSKRPSDQALDFLRASALFAAARLSRVTRRGGPGQHAVFRGDPPLAGAAEKRGQLVLDTRGADDTGAPRFDEHRALRVFEVVGCENGWA